MPELPHHWNMKNCVPHDWPEQSTKRRVYVIMFFKGKRSILMDRKYNSLGTMERRYAVKLLEEAKEKDWITEEWENYGGGPRPSGYPEGCEIAYWIEFK